MRDGYAHTIYSSIFSQIIQQLVNEELLSQNVEKENQLTLLALEHEERSAKAAQMVSKILKNFPNDELVASAYKNLANQFKGSLEYNASHILVKEEDQAKTILKDLEEGNRLETIQMSKRDRSFVKLPHCKTFLKSQNYPRYHQLLYFFEKQKSL